MNFNLLFVTGWHLLGKAYAQGLSRPRDPSASRFSLGGSLNDEVSRGEGRGPARTQVQKEDDLSDLMSGGLGGMKSIDADRGLDYGMRRKRMYACASASRAWVEDRGAQVEAAIGMFMAQSQSSVKVQGSTQALSEEEAVSSVMFSRIIACYQNIDNETVSQINSGVRLSKTQEEVLMKEPTAQVRPSRSQYNLLESVMKEIQAKHMEELGPESMPGGVRILGQGMSPRVQLAYVVMVTLMFSGAMMWVWRRLIYNSRESQRTMKTVRKIAKAEKTLDKKRR